jgi:hypothetical protein
MSIFQTELKQDYLGEALPQATEPTVSPLEALEASYYQERLTFQQNSDETANKLYWEPTLDRIEEVTGQRPARPDIRNTRELTDAVDRFFYDNARFMVGTRYADSVEQINALISQYPELEQELGIKAVADHISATEQLAIDAEKKAVSQERTALGEIAGFLGTVGAEFRLFADDPTYGAASVLGGGARAIGKPAVTNIARIAFGESIVAAGLEASRAPSVAAWRKRVGLEYDAETFFTSVAAAGAGGLIIGGAIATPIEVLARRGEKKPGARVGMEMLRAVDETTIYEVDAKMQQLSAQQYAEGLQALEEAGVDLPPVARGAIEVAESQGELLDNNPLEDDAEIEHLARELEAEAFVEGEIDTLPPAQPTAELRPRDIYEADNLDNTIFKFDPATIETDAKTFQYKSGGDEFGVTDKYRSVKVWDPSKSGQVIVYEYADGRRVIADGHQRLGIAKRILAEDPDQNPILYGTLLREVDGISPQAAMVQAARKNITEAVDAPGNKVIDAAKLEREVPGALDDPSLPVGASLMRQARDLVELSDLAFGMVINELVPSNYAAIVGRLVEGGDRQMAVLQVLADVEPANVTQAEAIVRQAMAAEFDEAVQVGLFGEQLVTASLFKERARVLDAALKQLKQDRAVFNSLVENRARIEGEGNVLAAAQNQSRSEIDGQAIQIIQAVANRKGELSDALTAAARELADTGNAAAASRSFVDAVREAISRGELDGADVSNQGRAVDAAAEGDRLAASPGREELAAFDEPDTPAIKQQADQLERDYVGDQPREAQQPDVAMRQDLKAKIDAGATRDEIDAHPAIVEALKRAAEIPETKNAPGYLGDDWVNNREFIFDDETVDWI